MTEATPWYRDGLCFECTQCGDCCTGAPGVVWVNDDEIAQIAAVLDVTTAELRKRYTRKVGKQVSLTEHANGDCVFFDADTRKCTVYSARPAQCRTWPFWNSNLESRAAWRETERVCPGAGKGQLYTLEQIQSRASVVDV